MYGARMFSRRTEKRHRGTVCRGVVKYQELKANIERLHIETSSSMLINEQLMFEAAGGSNKGHVYGFGFWLRICNHHRLATGEAAARHQFRWYLLRLPMMPVLRGRRSCGDTCSRHMPSSSAS
ncbi:hypothetical protein M9H77_02659 [Catharanthus roseus]|uniref:Uncharacterized protein n=1 Tax=Catharanthus roseus TaxID=4058 RepID=A0ACC0C9J2_CATRO|nr:hypothetical protein M9H77_02659 [Catharanthus roseus]